MPTVTRLVRRKHHFANDFWLRVTVPFGVRKWHSYSGLAPCRRPPLEPGHVAGKRVRGATTASQAKFPRPHSTLSLTTAPRRHADRLANEGHGILGLRPRPT